MDPRVKHLLMMNKRIEKCKLDPGYSMVFYACIMDWSECAVWTVADTIFGNADDTTLGSLGEKVRSQAGCVLGLCVGPSLESMQDRVHVLEWSSSSIKRVVWSTPGVEAYGVVDAAEAAEWVSWIVAGIRSPLDALPELENPCCLPRTVWFTDSDSLCKALQKDYGKPADERVRIAVARS